MGADASTPLLQPEWSAEDERTARPLPLELKEKLQALDYRVRKGLTRWLEHLGEIEDSNGESELLCTNVLYHIEDIPSSLDRLRVASAFFTFDIDKLQCDRRCRTNIVVASLKPPAVGIPAGVPLIPHKEVAFYFSVAERVPARRLWGKTGKFAVRSVALRMHARAWVDGKFEEPPSDGESDTCCSDDDSDFDGEAEEPRNDEGGGNPLGNWVISSLSAFARSEAFLHGVDAEIDDWKSKRWWNEKESLRQGATVALNLEAIQPRGTCASWVLDGCTVLDLHRCRRGVTKPKPFTPWTTHNATRQSTQQLWALLAQPAVRIATPFGRRPKQMPSSATSLGRLRACAAVGLILAAFILEPSMYEFEVEIFFATTLSSQG